MTGFVRSNSLRRNSERLFFNLSPISERHIFQIILTSARFSFEKFSNEFGADDRIWTCKRLLSQGPEPCVFAVSPHLHSFIILNWFYKIKYLLIFHMFLCQNIYNYTNLFVSIINFHIIMIFFYKIILIYWQLTNLVLV